MTGSAVDVVTNLLQNLGNPEVVQSLVATDAVYVSLNQDNPELKQILPWAGTHHGPTSFTDALGTMFTWWANEQFEPTDIVGDDDRAAVFGTFRYRSHTLDKVVTSPFAILIRVADGLITYLQFMEDTYATAASFRSAGSWTVHGDPSGQHLNGSLQLNDLPIRSCDVGIGHSGAARSTIRRGDPIPNGAAVISL